MRFRPRFSIRTLAIFVTLVCAYFAAWEATKKYGLPTPWPSPAQFAFYHPFADETVYCVYGVKAPMPFLVRYLECVSPPGPANRSRSPDNCCYYVWLLGPKFKLPIRFDHKPPPLVLTGSE